MTLKTLRPRTLLALAAVLVLGGSLAWYAAPDERPAGAAALVTRVKRGDFKVVVTTTGELRARKFVQIQGPTNAPAANQYQMKIASLVPEGTVVKAGDIVAELDRSGIAAKLAEVSLALQKAEAQYAQAQLDSTLTLAQAREEMRNMEYALEEKRIAKEQATYEAPSVKRQAEIDLEKAQRALEQGKANYRTKQRQAEAKMREVGADLERQRNLLGVVQNVMNGYTIRAPEPGMVIYEKEWNGKKKTAGTQIGAWDPTVATLPDLTEMESVTYINEIDVRKIAVGQTVDISLDADPSKRLTGKVVAVANVGEQRPNADAKVFEVKITVIEKDTTLRPGMTTANAILAAPVPNALSVPLEAVVIDDNIPYVYKRDGGSTVRQEIETGAVNENEIVVARGLTADDEVLLSPPPDAADLRTVRLQGGRTAPRPDSAKTDARPDSATPAPPPGPLVPTG
jgi:multidrug efflux pump subunit AcrA (membrane-fusion protein)